MNGHQEFHVGRPLITYLKSFLVLSVMVGHAVALGASSAAFHQGPLDEEVHVEPPREAQEARDVLQKCLRALPGLRGAPKAWVLHSTKELEKASALTHKRS